MEFNNMEKLGILKTLLKEKYTAENIMRERCLKFTLWILGYLMGFFWLLLTSKYNFGLFTKILLTLIVILTGYISFHFIHSIETGFKVNRKLIIKIEDLLNLYSKNTFIEGESLYPKDYKKSIKKSTSFFISLYLPLIFIHIILMLTIWRELLTKSTKSFL